MSDSSDPIYANRVRYIKLGKEGGWEAECLERGIVRFGFGTAERFGMCRDRKWEDLTKSFLAEGKDKGTATRFTNETRLFFDDDGSMLWITFMRERLYWGFLEPNPAELHESGDGVFRKVRSGWRCDDLRRQLLTKDRLSGTLTKLSAYRGTSCGLGQEVAFYVIRRINGQKTLEVEQAEVALEEMKRASVRMMGLLEPKDFEIFVGLIFSVSGWRRQGVVGETQKILDMDLILPSTGERALVQIKSKTDQQDLEKYVAFLDQLDFDRMFFIYHDGTVETNNKRVYLIGPDKLAEMALDAGLATWLMRKVS